MLDKMKDATLRSRVASLVLRGATFDIIRRFFPEDADMALGEAALGVEFDKFTNLLVQRELFRRAAAEKALWMSSVYRQMAVDSGDTSIESLEHFNVADFFAQYYFRNRPVKLPGFGRQWQSFESWSIANLVKRFGDEQVEVMLNRDQHPDFDENVDKTRATMRFVDFVGMVEAAVGETNDFYLVARNLALRSTFAPLVSELRPYPGLLSEHRADYLNLWIGPPGTLTRLHHDATNVLFVQLSGTKQMFFIPPYETELVYNRAGSIAEADAEQPDLERFPLMAAATITSVTLEEGDAVFIPVGWWHQVRSRSASVSLTFINFVYNNFFNMSDYPHARVF